jgi:hypothetical protein
MGTLGDGDARSITGRGDPGAQSACRVRHRRGRGRGRAQPHADRADGYAAWPAPSSGRNQMPDRRALARARCRAATSLRLAPRRPARRPAAPSLTGGIADVLRRPVRAAPEAAPGPSVTISTARFETAVATAEGLARAGCFRPCPTDAESVPPLPAGPPASRRRRGARLPLPRRGKVEEGIRRRAGSPITTAELGGRRQSECLGVVVGV